MYKQLKILIIVIVVIVLFFSGFFYTVREGEYAIVTAFGEPRPAQVTPGLKFKLPYPIHKVNRFDARQQIFVSRLVELLTKDKKNINIRCYLTYQIDDPLLFFQSTGNLINAQQKLDDLIIATGGSAVGDFLFDDLISIENAVRINDLEARIRDSIANVSEKEYGVKIIDVGISRLALPQANANAVYNRMRAERTAIANQYRAEGDREASKIRAEANRRRSEIESDAERKAQIIMGEGDAEAAKIYAEAFSKDPEFYQFWRTLEAYAKILDENTTLVLTQDSELFKYLSR